MLALILELIFIKHKVNLKQSLLSIVFFHVQSSGTSFIILIYRPISKNEEILNL